MHEDMMEKIETLKDMIGSRDKYLETSRMLQLDKKEKDLFMRASLEVHKSTPNFDIIDQAHAILVSKSFKEEDATDDTVSDEATDSESVKHTDTTTTHNLCTSCGNKLDTNAQFCSECGKAIPKVATHASSNTDSKHTVKGIHNNKHYVNKAKSSTPYNDSSNNPNKSIKIWAILLLVVVFAYVISNYMSYSNDIDKYTSFAQNTFGTSGRDSREIAYDMKDLQDSFNGEDGIGIVTFLVLFIVLILVISAIYGAILEYPQVMKRIAPQKKPSFIVAGRVVSLAPAWKRLVAGFIDILVATLASSTMVAFGIKGSFVIYLPYLILSLYFAYILRGNDGQAQTLGQKIMNIKLISEDGEPISTIKYSLYGAFVILYLFLLSIVVYFFNEKRKLFHNSATKTIVVEGNIA